MRQGPLAAFLSVLLFSIVCDHAEALTSTTILNNGAVSQKVDIVFLGDGYTASQMAQYQSDVQKFSDYLFTQPPFSHYKSFFNVHRVDVISAETGASNSCTSTTVNNALGSTYMTTGADCRLLMTNNSSAVNTAANSAPAKDVIIVIVNSAVYGGAARFGQYGVFYNGSGGPEVMVHELGHSFGLLHDEYTYGGPAAYTGPEPAALNVSINTNRATLKWKDWVAPTTVFPTTTTTADAPGLYEGARYSATGIYRPTHNSKMRALYVPFERVNYSLLVDRFFAYLPADPTPPTASLACGLQSGLSLNATVTAADPESYVRAYRLSKGRA